jgi:WD40 repeat protein
MKRFSLRTLLLFSLTLASGGLLAVHWAPWQHTMTIPGGAEKKPEVGDGYQTLVAFSPDGQKICHCGDRTFPRVRAAETGQELFALKGDVASVTSVSFSPNGSWLVSAGSDGVARLWDARTGEEKKQFASLVKATLNNASFSSDSKWIVTAGNDGMARVWDVESGKQLAELADDVDETMVPESAHCAVFAPDCRIVAVIRGRRIYFCETGNWKRLAHPSVPTAVTNIFSAAFSPDGSRLITGHWDGSARIWSVPDLAPCGTVPHRSMHIHAVAYLHDGEKIMTASCDSLLKIWDATTLAPLTESMQHPDLICASVAPGSRAIATASRDGTVWIWSCRHPEKWWGVAWLPEFWLAAALACATIFSLISDKRIHNRARTQSP